MAFKEVWYDCLTMRKAKMTISITEELAEYLRSTPSVSSTIAEAVEIFRARELEFALEEAYKADASEAGQLNSDWSAVDAEIEE